MPEKTESNKEQTGTEVYWALLRVAAKVETITKIVRPELGYAIAGAQQVMAAVRPALLEEKLILFPITSEIIRRDEFESKNGRMMNRAVVKVVWRFYHCVSGNYLDIPVEGEGQDIGDKSIQKARTISQKYALRQALMLEFGDSDPDNDPSEHQERATASKQTTNKQTTKPPVEKGHGPDKVDEGTEMATEEAWSTWLDLATQAKALKIPIPNFEYPLPLTVLRKAYKDINDKVKAAAPKETS